MNQTRADKAKENIIGTLESIQISCQCMSSDLKDSWMIALLGHLQEMEHEYLSMVHKSSIRKLKRIAALEAEVEDLKRNLTAVVIHNNFYTTPNPMIHYVPVDLSKV